MKFYQEITLLPNPEAELSFLWFKTFMQIHLGLVEIQDERKETPIGISFPKYIIGTKAGKLSAKLGDKIRLFANDESTLEKFDAKKLLSRLQDYVHYTSIRPVPEKITGYAIYNRYTPKVNNERLARRYAKRHNLNTAEEALNEQITKYAEKNQINYDEAKELYQAMDKKRVTLPFIKMKSLSTGQDFCLWIKKISTNQEHYQKFNSYGLSSRSTTPEF